MLRRSFAYSEIGRPKTGTQADASGLLQQAVIAYYERMPEHLYKIPEAELKQLIDSKAENIYIFDIRDPKDYALGHISGAHNIAFDLHPASNLLEKC